MYSPCRPVRVTPLGSVNFRVRENTAIATIISRRTGIRILEYFSMPFSTPLNTTQAVMNMKITANMEDCTGFVMKLLKKVSTEASLP